MPKCDICHKYFTTKAQMKQHRIKEHTRKILVQNLEFQNKILIYVLLT
jgi:hypothetical protein